MVSFCVSYIRNERVATYFKNQAIGITRKTLERVTILAVKIENFISL